VIQITKPQKAVHSEILIPHEIVSYCVYNGFFPAKAWRKYLKLTKAEVSNHLGITQEAYTKIEAKRKIKKSTRKKIANALGIQAGQLDF
jgi:DNA-binding XRE family transcriptional regulator